jgi:hypothetical protein
MDQTAPADTAPAPLRKIATRIVLVIGGIVMVAWSIVLPVLGILYAVEHFL